MENEDHYKLPGIELKHACLSLKFARNYLESQFLTAPATDV